MSYKRIFLAICLFSILVVLVIALPRGLLQVRLFGVKALPYYGCYSSGLIDVEKALCLMNNWFVSNGIYQGTIVGQQNLWSIDFNRLGTELGRYPGSFLTPWHFYRAGVAARVIPAQDGPFNYFKLRLENPYYEGRLESSTSFRITDCNRYVPVDASTPDRAQVIAFNAYLKYACSVLSAYGSTANMELTYNYIINESGAPAELESYLNDYIAQGLLASFELDIADNNLTLHLPPDAPGIKEIRIWLTPERINPLSILVESSIKQEMINQVQQSAIILFSLRTGEDAVRIPKKRLFNAIDAVRKLGQGTASEKRLRFMQSYYGFDPTSPAPPPSAPEESSASIKSMPSSPAVSSTSFCSYPPGVVTPCNQTVFHLIGADYADALSPHYDIEALHDVFKGVGYNVTTIDFNLIAKNQAKLEFGLPALSKLKEAQSVLIEAHGSERGSFAVGCFPDIRYGTPKCCEKVKNIADTLGFDTSRMNCAGLFPTMCSSDSNICAVSSLDFTCDGRPTLDFLGLLGQGSRCETIFDRKTYISMGPKAFVATVQCYGGADDHGNWHYLSNYIIDFYSGRWEPYFVHATKWDFPLLAEDLRGTSSSFVSCVERSPKKQDKPGDHPWCIIPPQDKLMGFELRNVQSSFSIRGLQIPSMVNIDGIIGPICWDTLNQVGWRQYCQSNVSGNANRTVELFPTVDSLSYYPSTGWVYISFTSDVEPCLDCLTVTKSSSVQPRQSKKPLFTSKYFEAKNAAVRLDTSNLTLMSRAEWDARPNKERQWPYYIEVKLSGLKVNWPDSNIKFGGNRRRRDVLPWVWPDGNYFHAESPAMVDRGREPGTDFTVAIPVKPRKICCLPKIDTVACREDDGRVGYACVRNGCTCNNSVTTEADCRVQPWFYWGSYWAKYWGYGGWYCEHTFEGTLIDFAECCNDGDAAMNCSSVIYEPAEPPGSCYDNNGERNYQKTTYQYKNWPVDRGDPLPCEAISCIYQPAPVVPSFSIIPELIDELPYCVDLAPD